MLSSTSRILTGKPSLFLDSLRLSASLTVIVVHALAIWFPRYEYNPFTSKISHGAVVVFFVLSGFVIAHTTASNNRGARQYATARLSRLYSIFFPALAITAVCSIILYCANTDIFLRYNRNHSVFRYLISLVYSNEIWFFSSAPLLNGPIWSLSYEFWYYVIFGCFFFRKGGIKSFILPIIVCLIAGPKILLMMFMWLAGWLAYHLRRPDFGAFSWVASFVLLVCGIGLMLLLPSLPYAMNTPPLYWASQFLSDWGISLFVAGALCVLPAGIRQTSEESRRVKMFRKIADLTFPIYVLHYPLLVMAKALLIPMTDKWMQFCIGLVSVLAFCVITGFYLESKRYLWNDLFKKLVNKLYKWLHKFKSYTLKYS